MSIGQSHIIWLSGTFPEAVPPPPDEPCAERLSRTDIMQRFIVSTLADAAPTAPGDAGTYVHGEKIPRFYNGYNAHPKHTGTLCWVCADSQTANADGFGWFVPHKLPGGDADVVSFLAEGYQCSLPCAKRHIDVCYVDSDQYSELTANLRKLALDVAAAAGTWGGAQAKINHVWAAPCPQTNIVEFGQGDVSREEYREILRTLTAKTYDRR